MPYDFYYYIIQGAAEKRAIIKTIINSNTVFSKLWKYHLKAYNKAYYFFNTSSR
jgi:hypothetical protein